MIHAPSPISIKQARFFNPILGQLEVKRKCLLISMFVFFFFSFSEFFLYRALKLELLGFEKDKGRDFNATGVIVTLSLNRVEMKERALELPAKQVQA